MLSRTMFSNFSPRPTLWRFRSKALIALGILGLSSMVSFGADDTGTGPNLLEGNFDSGTDSYNPWGGIDLTGNFHVWDGKQFAVNDAGHVDRYPFSPSVAAGDLRGTGLLDLVVADPRGYFWFFPNSGTPKAPVFTHGEVMPVWCGGGWFGGSFVADDPIPRIQLIDYDNDGKLDLVVGTNTGELYFVHNKGAVDHPDFSTPPDRSGISIPTHSDNVLWCNYLAPFFYDWSGSGRLDLLMGEGTYSANSIYLLTNQGGNMRPVLNEKHREKIIPGMGREHLIPQVVDWNNDGKPDVIAGERTGVVNVYLNQAANKGDPPTFDKDKPLHVNFGSSEKVGLFATVCVADLNKDGLFDLIVANADGNISYSLNTGTAGSPKFGPLVSFKGIMPFPKIMLPNGWQVDRYRPYGIPFGTLECTNAKIEKGFVPPPDTKMTGAMKFSVYDTKPVYFKERYDPQDDRDILNNNTILAHGDGYDGTISLEVGVRYTLTMWIRSPGDVSNIVWEAKTYYDGLPDNETGTPMEPGSDWTRVQSTVMMPKLANYKPGISANVAFRLYWKGNGTLYLDGISLKKANQ